MGYGDVPLTTPEVRLFACFHILVSVSWLAALMSSVFNLRDKRNSQLVPVESVIGWKYTTSEPTSLSQILSVLGGCMWCGLPGRTKSD